MTNSSQTFSATTAVPFGAVTGVSGGMASAFAGSANATVRASGALIDNSGPLSLLHSLNELFKEPLALNNTILETFPQELRGGLMATNNSVAIVMRNLLLGISSIAPHAVQLPTDTIIALINATKALTHIQIPSDKILPEITKASRFDREEKNSTTSVGNLLNFAGKEFNKTQEKTTQNFNIRNNSHADTHESIAGPTLGGASTAASLAVPSASAFATDLLGTLPRECSALKHFIAVESAGAGDENFNRASSGFFQASSQSDSHRSKVELKNIEEGLRDIQSAKDAVSENSVSLPFIGAIFRILLLSLPIKSSQITNKTALVTTEGKLQKALLLATQQNPCGGADRINSLQSNIFSLSNLMRLCAANLNNSSPEIAAGTSELISSRASSMVISNIKLFAKALKKMTNNDKANTGIHKDSAIESIQINDQHCEDIFKDILNQVEAENGVHEIPKLNQSMATEITSTAQSVATSLIATHTTFIQPPNLISEASKKASDIQEAQKNEALMASLPGVTQILNTIQAATHNMMLAMHQKMEEKSSNSQNNRALSTHNNSAAASASVSYAASAILLLCDEMLSICRSLTLINSEQSKVAINKVSAINSKDYSNQITQQIAWDSHAGEASSSLHSITALRLTLSHTGIALIQIASALDDALKDNMETLKPELRMHTLQRAILNSCAYATRYLAEGLTGGSGLAMASLQSLVNSVDQMHETSHSADHLLHPQQTNDSEQSGDSSESFQATGFSTDMFGNTITNLLKVLSQATLIGVDSTSKLLKALEIICLHRDPHLGLKLETQQSSNPNGASKNSTAQPSVGSEVGTNALLINFLAGFISCDAYSDSQSILNMQRHLMRTIDDQIEALDMLKDEEEISDDKKGIKAFFRTMLELLVPDRSNAEYDSFIDRLNYGGIALSNYHSRFGAYGQRVIMDSDLVKKFANDDDANGILLKFINKAKKDYSLFAALHRKLPAFERSAKAENLYQQMIEELWENYQQIKIKFALNSHVFRKPSKDNFMKELGISSSQNEHSIPRSASAPL